MNAIEALKEKQAEELAKAIKHDAMKTAVAAALGLNDANFSAGYMHVHAADCHVQFEADTLSDAMLICERMNPLAMVRLKGTFLSFRADCRVTNKERTENKVETIMPYVYKIDGLRQYGDERTLVWYVEAVGYVVECRCKVKQDPDTRRDYHITFDRYGHATKHKNNIVNKSGHFPQQDRFWSSDDQPGNWVLWSY